MAKSAAGEFVDEGAQREIGVQAAQGAPLCHGAGPSTVLLHGFTQTGAAWRDVRAALPSGHKLLTPDLRGHGSAACRTPVTLSAVFEDLDELGVTAQLGGYSMGGRVALAYTLARPGRVRRLLLVGASPGLADPSERRARRESDERLARRIERDGVEAFAREWAALPLFAGQSPAVAEVARAERRRQTPSGLAAALRGLGTGVLPPLWDRLGELTVPVMLVVGERDSKFRAIAERMASRLPSAELTVIAGAGHAVHLEAPAAVAGLLSRPL